MHVCLINNSTTVTPCTDMLINNHVASLGARTHTYTLIVSRVLVLPRIIILRYPTMAPQCWAKTIPVLLILSVINSQGVLARSTGPPASEPEYHELVCDRMVPYHAQTDPQPGNGGYLIETDLPLSLNSATGFTYLAGRTYKGKVGANFSFCNARSLMSPAHVSPFAVKIVGTAATFRGFLMIAHVPGKNNTLLGSFIPQNSSQQTLSCDELSVNNRSSIGHSNAGPTVDFRTMELMWQAPSQDNGTVDFR